MQTCKVHAKLKSLLPLRSQVQHLLLKHFLDRHLPAEIIASVKLLGKFLFSYKSQKRRTIYQKWNQMILENSIWHGLHSV